MKSLIRLFLIALSFFIISSCSDDDSSSEDMDPISETVTDADGNVYQTIRIGNQLWMLENLKTTTFNDGTPITEFTFDEFGNNWLNFNQPMAFYQWADTSDLNNVVDEDIPFDAYGAMYNHLALESGKLAPQGWRIPTEVDFIQLENFLSSEGHTGNEATVLKTETGWLPSSGNGTNLYGFNALPNGYINAFGGPTLGQGVCTWATSNVIGESQGSQTRKLISLFGNESFNYDESAIQIGAGVRCIKAE